MNKIQLGNGLVKLTSHNGVKDTRDGSVYSEAVVKAADARFFAEA